MSLSFEALKLIYNTELARTDGSAERLLELEDYSSRFVFLGPLVEKPRMISIYRLPFPEFDTKSMTFEQVMEQLFGPEITRANLRKLGQKTVVHGTVFINNVFALKFFFEDKLSFREILSFPHEIAISITKMRDLLKARELLIKFTSKKIVNMIAKTHIHSQNRKLAYLFQRMPIVKDVSYFSHPEEYVSLDTGLPFQTSLSENFYENQFYKINWEAIDEDEIGQLAFLAKHISLNEASQVRDLFIKQLKTFGDIARFCKQEIRRLRFGDSIKPEPEKTEVEFNHELYVLTGLRVFDLFIEIPVNEGQLLSCAIELQNCLDTYEEGLRDASQHVLILRNESSRLYAVEVSFGVDNFEILEFLGVKNEEIEDEWLKEKYEQILIELMGWYLL